MIKVTGADIDTTRAVTPQPNFKPLPDSLLFAPRYDIAAWATPWPNEAIEDLFSGRDYEETAGRYNIKMYPELKPVVEDVSFDDSVPAESTVDFKKLAGKKVAKKKVEESEEELFDE